MFFEDFTGEVQRLLFSASKRRLSDESSAYEADDAWCEVVFWYKFMPNFFRIVVFDLVR